MNGHSTAGLIRKETDTERYITNSIQWARRERLLISAHFQGRVYRFAAIASRSIEHYTSMAAVNNLVFSFLPTITRCAVQSAIMEQKRGRWRARRVEGTGRDDYSRNFCQIDGVRGGCSRSFLTGHEKRQADVNCIVFERSLRRRGEGKPRRSFQPFACACVAGRDDWI